MDKSKWEYKKLEVDNLPIGDVFDIFMGRTPSRDDLSLWEDGSHEWVSIGDMGTTKYISDTKEKVSDKACTNMRLVPKDTVIMSFKLSIGKVAITEIPLYTNEAIMAFPPKSGYNISPNYLYYHLQAYKWQSANRAVMGKTLNKAVISSSRITIPDSETQQRIVAELDCLNEMIALKQEQLKEFDKLAQSIFYNMFGDIESNSKGFNKSQLGKVCQLKAGKAIKAEELREASEGLYPCYGGNGIRGFIDRFSHEGLFPIIGRQGALCGNINLAKGKFYATEHAVVVTPLVDMDRTWLAFVLQSMHLEKYAHGVAQPGLSVKDLNPLDTITPPLALQQQFAEKIQAIEAQKELVKQSIAETQHLLDSRMDYYFD